MKAKLFILTIFICSCSMGFSQKKSAYLISPITATCKVISTKQSTQDKQATTTQNQIEEPKKETNNTNNLTKLMEEQKDIDSHYIAYLNKIELFNYKYKKEIAESFDLEYIKHLIKTLSEKELKEKSEGYSKELRKYRL
ncbi:MAG: hypothetical protein U0K81_03725 [Paludibacteraceae bacterium]|nr:hypothetical protein [Paludibacteraceae bacterium]